MELDFGKILEGKDQAQETPIQPQNGGKDIKLTQTEARTRQQSCMINEIDKNLVLKQINLASNEYENSKPSQLSGQPEQYAQYRIFLFIKDKNDESLENYKKNLLGDIKEDELKEDEAAEVEIVKVEIECPDRPKGNIVLDFKKKEKSFQIKEGSVYRMKIHFNVRFDIVYGLKFVNNVYKMFARVDQEEEKMGSFAPQPKPHVFDLSWIEAPSGLLARGDFKGKGLFLDNDGIVHCQFDYICKIGSDW